VYWQPSDDHDAVHVATLNLQHLLLCELRRLAGDEFTSDLSRLLGVSPRTVQRIIAGDHILGLEEVIEIACLYGDEVLTAIPRTVTSLFPDVYQRFLGPWHAGLRELPDFATPRIPDTIAWASVIVDLRRWLTGESLAGRISLVNVSVVAHRLASSLADLEIPGSLIMAATSSGFPTGWLSLDVLTRTPTHIALCYLLDPVDEPVNAMRDMLIAFYRLLAQDGQKIALLCLGQRMEGQLRVHVPGLTVARAKDTVAIPFQVAGSLKVPAAAEYGAADLTLTLEAGVESEHGIQIFAVSLG
jgi:hypothetical protein